MYSKSSNLAIYPFHRSLIDFDILRILGDVNKVPMLGAELVGFNSRWDILMQESFQS
jgi:hypothetical protein